jgi:hypothetical protein
MPDVTSEFFLTAVSQIFFRSQELLWDSDGRQPKFCCVPDNEWFQRKFCKGFLLGEIQGNSRKCCWS